MASLLLLRWMEGQADDNAGVPWRARRDFVGSRHAGQKMSARSPITTRRPIRNMIPTTLPKNFKMPDIGRSPSDTGRYGARGCSVRRKLEHCGWVPLDDAFLIWSGLVSSSRIFD